MGFSGYRKFGFCFVAVIAATYSVYAGEEMRFPAFPTLRFTHANIIEYPPGDIQGQVSRPDGTAPDTFMRTLLIDPETGDEIYSTNTGADGRFMLNDVAPGRYLIRVGLPGVIYILDVKPGAETEPIPKNFVRLPAGDIRGGIALPGGEIPTKEEVKIIDPDTGEVLMSTTIDENGDFLFEGVLEGVYLVRVESPGLVLTLEVAGDQPAFLDIVVPRTAVIPVTDERSPPPYVINVLPGVAAGGYYWYRPNRRRREVSSTMP